MFNSTEVKVVVKYIEQLLTPGNHHAISQSDIGIVTPYKKQGRCIAEACQSLEYNDITIGTAEAFQGQEKPVIIISTVRSGGKRLSFVNNPRVSNLFQNMMPKYETIKFNFQRFNVMITRAKCLLIVVGDRSLLQHDPNWKQFIDFCSENNALI